MLQSLIGENLKCINNYVVVSTGYRDSIRLYSHQLQVIRSNNRDAEGNARRAFHWAPTWIQSQNPNKNIRPTSRPALTTSGNPARCQAHPTISSLPFPKLTAQDAIKTPWEINLTVSENKFPSSNESNIYVNPGTFFASTIAWINLTWWSS